MIVISFASFETICTTFMYLTKYDVFPKFRTCFKGDLQRKMTSYNKIEIFQQPLVRPSPNFELMLKEQTKITKCLK